MTPPTTWEYWGQELTWLTRAGDVKHLHGQAFFPRTSVPPEHGKADHLDFPDVAAEPPPIDEVKLFLSPVPIYGNIHVHWTQPYTGDSYTGLSVFQINPRARQKYWELKHTRLVFAHSPLIIAYEGWSEFIFLLSFPCTTPDELRAFIRIYNRTAFLNFGPMTGLPS